MMQHLFTYDASLRYVYLCTFRRPAIAPNNGRPGKTVVNKALTFYCKSSPSSRVLTSVRNGALLGAAKGAYFGFVSGEIFGCEVTFGLSGVGGAGLGAVIQGTIGATTFCRALPGFIFE